MAAELTIEFDGKIVTFADTGKQWRVGQTVPMGQGAARLVREYGQLVVLRFSNKESPRRKLLIAPGGGFVVAPHIKAYHTASPILFRDESECAIFGQEMAHSLSSRKGTSTLYRVSTLQLTEHRSTGYAGMRSGSMRS